MTKYARIIDNVAVDVVEEDPAILFHQEIAVQFEIVADEVTQGSKRKPDGTWVIAEPSLPHIPGEVLPLLTPMTLYMAFKPLERITIKTSTDPYVQEFWAMYQLSVQLDKPTDPNLKSVIEALNYLAQPKTATPAGAGILASFDRVQEIRRGVPQ